MKKVEQVKSYLNAVENPHNPLHEAVKDTKGCRLVRGKSWMRQAEDSVLQVCQLTELKRTKERERYLNRFRRLYRHTCQETWESTVENVQQAKHQEIKPSKTSRGQAKLQALVYDILLWRKVPESGARSVRSSLSFKQTANRTKD